MHEQNLPLTPVEQQLKRAYQTAAALLRFDPDRCHWMELHRLQRYMEPVIQQVAAEATRLPEDLTQHCYAPTTHPYNLRYCPLPPGDYEQYELVAQVQGRSVVFIGGDRVVLERGDVVLMLPGTYQRFLTIEDDSLRQSFLIQPSAMAQLQRMLDPQEPLQAYLNCLLSGQRRRVYRTYRVPMSARTWEILDRMHHLYTLPEASCRLLRESGLLSLLLAGLEATGTGCTMQVPGPPGSDKSDQIITYMEDHLATVTRRELAERFHYSERHITRLVERRVGNSFTRYLQLMRLRRMASLLALTDLPVGEIAVACGYRNDSYFYNLFRQRFGLSPQEYREQA